MPVSKGRKSANKRPAPPPTKDPVKSKGPSPQWYVTTMFGTMGLGAIIIVVNYMAFVPGTPRNTLLLGGLAFIGVGFAMTMDYR